jgi:hypothetical protein
MAVERYAEDGNGSYLAGDFSAYGGSQLQTTLVADTGIPPIAPGGTATLQVEVDGSQPSGRYLSFLAMVLPSNDAFVANDNPMSFPVFDGSGAFMGLDVMIAGSHVHDAGTEMNDELPANTAFLGQMSPDTGVSENGVVAPAPGFTPRWAAAASWTTRCSPWPISSSPDYPLLHITVTRESAAATGDTPGSFTLSPAYPNPFNPSTTLSFSLAEHRSGVAFRVQHHRRESGHPGRRPGGCRRARSHLRCLRPVQRPVPGRAGKRWPDPHLQAGAAQVATRTPATAGASPPGSARCVPRPTPLPSSCALGLRDVTQPAPNHPAERTTT